ncbi:TolB family protein [Micromonospora echinospora]|uniref:TolB family protein n=1 Tax=Micromonospora echinospora TaxID=1877 RepID=UPI0037A0D072
MDSKLTETMRDSVAGVSAYVSFEGLVAEAGLRRRHRAVVAAAVVLVLVLGVIVAPPLVGWQGQPATVGTTSGASEALSLPDRVGTPQLGAWSVQRRPVAAASMIFTAENWWYEPSSMGYVAAVSTSGDDYRLLFGGWGDPAGEEVLLSSDGGTVAMANELVELRTGKTRRLPSVSGTEETFPVAWSRGGDRLAVVGFDGRYMRQPDTTDAYTETRAVLAVWEIATNQLTTITELDPRTLFYGWLAAFGPDGRTLAYQSGRTITVITVGGEVRSRFTVPEGTQLAGKGTWTPDGRRLTLVTQRRCCDGDAYPSRWQLRTVDPNTGAELPTTTPLAEQAGLVALRLLGWAPDGAGVVVRYHPRPDAEVAGFGARDGITYGEWTKLETDVVALTDNGTRLLLAGTGEAMHGVDIADDVIASGRTHAGKLPPDGIGPQYRMYLKIAGLAIVAVLLIAGAAVLTNAILRRNHRRRRSGIGSAPGTDLASS